MRSIRGRLLAILLAGTALVWALAVGWIYLSTQARIEKVLDARLSEAARMVGSLVAEGEILPGVAAALPLSGAAEGAGYERQLACQIWSLDGRLVGRSASAPEATLAVHRDGFDETMIDGQSWRVFAVEDLEHGVRVLVGDNLASRDRLVNDVVAGLLVPGGALLPALIGLIWLSVGSSLRPIADAAAGLEARDAADLAPIDTAKAPTEIAPMLAALNGLFGKVAAARDHEREFTAYAAHELRTPLAGLRTQAQVALAAPDPAIRTAALGRIIQSVDRTSRLASQLLSLAQVEAAVAGEAVSPIAVADVVCEVARDHRAAADARGVTIDLDGDGDARAAVYRDLLAAAVRNLVENAVQHAPRGSAVRCRVEPGDAIRIEIRDSGPGIEADEIPRVTDRFYRGRTAASRPGSGLGLAIVAAAVGRMGGTLALGDAPEGGLAAVVMLPAHAIGRGSGDTPPDGA